MSMFHDKAEKLGREHVRRLEVAIDAEVEAARKVYEECKLAEDPYAMHKAIEPLSLAGLSVFAGRRAEEMLDAVQRMRDTRERTQ